MKSSEMPQKDENIFSLLDYFLQRARRAVLARLVEHANPN